MPTKPEILKRETLTRTRLFRVDQVHLKFSNGEERIYEKLVGGHGGAVLVVPLLENGDILMIREYALGLEDYHLACPKGALDPNESLFEAANRELKEEVGYGARQFKLLKQVYLSPSYMEHKINVVLAQDLYPEKLIGDEPEPIEVEKVNLNDLSTLCWRDDVIEGRSLAALFLVREWLNAKTTSNSES